MTEEEARENICPILLQAGRKHNCYTTGCMAWRWIPKTEPVVDEKGHVHSMRKILEPTDGYCGRVGP